MNIVWGGGGGGELACTVINNQIIIRTEFSIGWGDGMFLKGEAYALPPGLNETLLTNSSESSLEPSQI